MFHQKMDKELKDSILKTGTTLLGIVCKDGIVMAADRQVTLGQSIIIEKDFQKVIKINDYLLYSGCGSASDMLRMSKTLPAELKLKELRSKARPTVREAASLASSMAYTGIRQPSMVPFMVGMLIAGYNEDGTFELYSVSPDGSIRQVKDYDPSMSSGMPYVLGLLERQYKKDMTLKEGIELAREAIKSSTQRDAASGYGMDIFTITSDGIKKVVEQQIVPNYVDE